MIERWFAPDFEQPSYAVARWIWLRALGGTFFSAFYSLYFQIHGLIGSNGLLPAAQYLDTLHRVLGAKGYWLAPTVLWFNASDRALDAIVWIGLMASVAIILNLWPRVSIAIAGICFLSFIGAAQDFASYQSDGMLLEAALLSTFFAPRGVRPGLGRYRPPSLPLLFILPFSCFLFYFFSFFFLLLLGSPHFLILTSLSTYYLNLPLPSFLFLFLPPFPLPFPLL